METDNLHTQVTQLKYTSNTTHKQSKQTESNQNCKTLGLFILLSAEIWVTVMKNGRKCKQFFFKKKRKKKNDSNAECLNSLELPGIVGLLENYCSAPFY